MLRWTPRAQQTLENFLSQVPADWRDRVRSQARSAAIRQAEQIGNHTVDIDEVVVGYIQATPMHLRPALRPVLEAAGIDITRYQRHFG